MTGSRAFSGTSATRPRPSWAPTLPASEKFTTSVTDGIDIRETLRNWHTGRPLREGRSAQPGLDRGGRLPLRLARRPAGLHQPRHLVRRARRGVDPGLLRHRPAEEPGRAGHRPGRVWRRALPLPAPGDPRYLDRSPTSTSPTRSRSGCLAAAFLHSEERHVAVVSPGLPPAAWRRLARRFGRKIVHLPLKRFSGPLLERPPQVPRAQRQDRPLLRGRLHPRWLMADAG